MTRLSKARPNPRTLLLLVLALIAVRMAGRALKHQAGLAQVLWVLIGQAAMAGTAGTAKSRATEDRLNALVPRIPVPQTAPGTSAGGVGAMGSTDIGYDPQNSQNEGGFNSSTSIAVVSSAVVGTSGPGTVSGGSFTSTGTFAGHVHSYGHTHSMTHMHSSSAALQSVISNLASDHTQLVADHNALKAALTATGVLQ